VRTLLAHRDARFYLAGQVLSTVGDNALWLAMGIWVKILTGSSSAAGLVFFAFTCGILLAPVTGLLADRMRRRPLLIAANLAAAAGVCTGRRPSSACSRPSWAPARSSAGRSQRPSCAGPANGRWWPWRWSRPSFPACS
jgi:MFS family permease